MLTAAMYYDSFAGWIGTTQKKELLESNPEFCKPALEIEKMRFEAGKEQADTQ